MIDKHEIVVDRDWLDLIAKTIEDYTTWYSTETITELAALKVSELAALKDEIRNTLEKNDEM